MKQKIKIKINYSSELEVRRILDTLEKIDWYKEKGYQPILPDEIWRTLDLKKNNIDSKFVNNVLASDYIQGEYDQISKHVYEKWEEISEVLKDNLEKNNLNFLFDFYEIVFTMYGVGGSYDLPNKITINIRDKESEGICRTIIHEIIHLNIESLIEKYKIGHWEKERIVDLTLSKIIPEMSVMQGIPEGVSFEKIDNFFYSHYPDFEKIIIEVAKI